MPERADVEVYRQYLNATALHQAIEHTDIESSDILADTSPQGLGRALKDNQFSSTHRRHGKYLFVELHNGSWLMMHFGMTGALKYLGADKKPPECRLAVLIFLHDMLASSPSRSYIFILL